MYPGYSQQFFFSNQTHLSAIMQKISGIIAANKDLFTQPT